MASGTPIDDVLTPVDKILFIEMNEHFTHSTAQVVIEREPSPIPVTGRTKRFYLSDDLVTGLIHKIPDRLNKTLST